MKPEIHLFIIWQKANSKKNKIIVDLKKKFEIIDIYEMHWSSIHFSKNISRFYGEKLPKGSYKERHCGTGPFTVVIVRDPNPIYGNRTTPNGSSYVNINTFDVKTLYRNWTGGGHRIHGTNTPEEAEHDIALLFGLDSDKFQSKTSKSWDGTIKKISQDLPGTDGWKSIKELFYLLNRTINYVVLRNFEGLPDQYNTGPHGDIDILTDNYKGICYISNSKKIFNKRNRVLNMVRISGEDILFDFRYIGDGYYDKKWEETILNRKVLSPNGFFVPNEEDYFYTLLYHASVHKASISKDYINRLLEMADRLDVKNFNHYTLENKDDLKSFLDKYMNTMGFQYTEPKDLSVFFNREIIGNSKYSIKRKILEKTVNVHCRIKNMLGSIRKRVH